MPQTDQDRRGSERLRPSGAAVAYFAKAPVAGQVKTRLCPPLTRAEAAGLYRGFLADVLRAVPEAEATYCYVWPPESLGEVPVPDGVVRRAQRGAGLFARMIACFDELFAEGHDRVLVRNTDSPDLPHARVARALHLARPGRVVLGPDRGGGYYLVALGEPCPELFEEVTEGAATVFETTVARARRLGLEVVDLPVERDVDTFDDLLEMWRARR